MQKFTLLGITLYDYGVREALRNTDRFLATGGLNTVAYISSAQIAQASRDEGLKDCVEQLDMTVCTEPDLLEAAGIAGRSRIHEIDEKIYLRELFRKLSRNRNSVYLLADTLADLEELEELIQEYQGNLFIRGHGAWEAFDRQPERLVNELNDVAPDVIVSRMPWPEDIVLMKKYGQYVNSRLWISLPYGAVSWIQNPSFLAKLKRKIHFRLFEKRVQEYNNKETGAK
ncbi:MAG TPA: hypothetical protein H9717_16520 [Candidatus Eisenbergiella merdipullorum]|uniref:Uncharacterized protein n=1 Tax=Candidatus Eisenbergiella merdipullorum TaxID=2838553 RepID=A0A9D2I8G9_9FIRM|nr:hypothetical protein [Candidatus Eisenbergiella merdipullorum]